MRWLLIPLAVIPAPALADLTAVYGKPGTNFEMKVEIASNGNVHGDMPGQAGNSIFTLGGEGYFVEPGPSGPIVMRVEDMATVLGEQIAKLGPQFRPSLDHTPTRQFVHKGTATVNGRTGAAFFAQSRDGRLSPRPWVVISDDPALTPLARAMAGQFDMSMRMMAKSIGDAAVKPMQEILKTGAPIVFTGAELQTVTFDPIPVSHFELPAKPASLENVRKQMMPVAVRPVR